MCKVIVESVKDGLIPTEKVVRITAADGVTEELALSVRQVFDGSQIAASEIARQGDVVLVELPRETATGRWRMWIHAEQVVA